MNSGMSAKTISILQDGSANALAINKDFNQVVIAGRNGKGILLCNTNRL